MRVCVVSRPWVVVGGFGRPIRWLSRTVQYNNYYSSRLIESVVENKKLIEFIIAGD